MSGVHARDALAAGVLGCRRPPCSQTRALSQILRGEHRALSSRGVAIHIALDSLPAARRDRRGGGPPRARGARGEAEVCTFARQSEPAVLTAGCFSVVVLLGISTVEALGV